MIVRERYMRLIRDFMDKPVIKIITGMLGGENKIFITLISFSYSAL